MHHKQIYYERINTENKELRRRNTELLIENIRLKEAFSRICDETVLPTCEDPSNGVDFSRMEEFISRHSHVLRRKVRKT